MEENEIKKPPRALYLTLAIVLAILAMIIIATTIARRSDTLPAGNEGENEEQANGDLDTLPDFSLPVSGDIAIDFSDTVPVFSTTMNDYRTHLGVDISASLGTEVIAVADGVVTNVWDDPFMGTCVSIEHAGNAISIYKNLDPTVPEGIVIGASVQAGDTIGAVGESAMNELAEEPHLHYEMKINGKHIDPKEHLPFPKPEPDKDESQDSNQTTESK